MRVLFIVHATSWCDKDRRAEPMVRQLISCGRFDQIIEVTSSEPEARGARYANHAGLVLEHGGVTPVPFFRDELFGEAPLFPTADAVTLVGGVLNSGGGGCLNVAFDFLVKHQQRLVRACEITIPIWATYPAWKEPWWEDPWRVEQVIKDLVWKMLAAEIPFELVMDDAKPIGCGHDVLVRLRIRTANAAPPCA